MSSQQQTENNTANSNLSSANVEIARKSQRPLTNDEVFILDNFDFEHSAIPSLLSDRNMMFARITLLCVNGMIQIWSLGLLDFYVNFCFLTHWGLHIVSISLVLNIVCAVLFNKHNQIPLVKATAILTEIAFVSQVCIVALYWSLIHADVIKDLDGHRARRGERWTEQFYQLMIIVHSLPAVAIFINIIISKVVLCFEHLPYMLVYGFTYLTCNLCATKYLGRPLYSFLTWEDFNTVIIALVIILGNTLAYFLVCKFMKIFRGDLLSYQDKVQAVSQEKTQNQNQSNEKGSSPRKVREKIE
eukprot:403377314